MSTAVRNSEVVCPNPSGSPKDITSAIADTVPLARREDVSNLVGWLVDATDDPILLNQVIGVLQDVVKTVPEIRNLVWNRLPQRTKNAIKQLMAGTPVAVPYNKRTEDSTALALVILIAYETSDTALGLAIELLRAVSIKQPELKRQVWKQLHPDIQLRIRRVCQQLSTASDKLY